MFQKTMILLCAMLLAGCYDTRSDQPIGTTTGLISDKAIEGIWKDDYPGVDHGVRLHVFRSSDNELTALWVDVPTKVGETGKFDEYQFSTSKLGNNRFISVIYRSDGADDKTPIRYRPLFYTLRNEGRTFTLYTIDDERTAQTIESGALKGTIEKHTEKRSDGTTYVSYDKVLITAPPAELDAFMAKPEAAALFQVYMVFKKIE